MVARAMKNFGLGELVLVAPACPLDEEAYRLAAHAGEILDGARVVADLHEALHGARLVVGTTARVRERYPGLVLGPREAAYKIGEVSRLGDVALLFGRENFGLFNQELDRCQYIVRIPADPQHTSLNLAQAVLLIAYELRLARLGTIESNREQQADVDELEHFFLDLEAYLAEVGYADSLRMETVMRGFRRIYHKAALSAREVRQLRGVLRQSRWAIGRPHD